MLSPGESKAGKPCFFGNPPLKMVFKYGDQMKW
jgi:hypothetical protein